MSIVHAFLRILFSIGAFGGVAWWIVSCDWSTAMSSEHGRAPEEEVPRISIVDISCSADGDTLLSLVRGEFPHGSPLLLHRLDEGLHARPVPASGYNVWQATLVPDASAVVVSDESRCVSRIELSANIRVPLLTVPVQNGVTDLAVSPDGRVVAVALESEIVFCDARKGGELYRIPVVLKSASRLAFSDDGRRLAVGSGDGTLRIWNLGEIAPMHVLPAHSMRISQVRFFDASRKIASVGLVDDQMRTFDVATGEPLWQVAAGQSGLMSLAVSPDGRVAATGGLDTRIRLWNLRERAPLGTITAHTGVINALHFTNDGKTLISAADSTIRCWERDFADSCGGIDLESVRPLAH